MRNFSLTLIRYAAEVRFATVVLVAATCRVIGAAVGEVFKKAVIRAPGLAILFFLVVYLGRGGSTPNETQDRVIEAHHGD